MKHFIYSFVFFGFQTITGTAWAQVQPSAKYELDGAFVPPVENSHPDHAGGMRGTETPPPFDNLRTMAEWEEIQSLNITWTTYPGTLKQIVKAAKEEVEVIILCTDSTEVEDYLMGSQAGGPLNNMDNIVFIEGDYDSVWSRDYSGNSVYGSEVDDLLMVDWLYNRPRPDDDASPQLIADQEGIDLYSTTAAPYDFMNTGGNFMTDGFGTAFASKLVLQENDGNGNYNIYYPDHTESEIDDIMEQFMGIDRYIKMETLDYDVIHHIDMHMKLLDEETILVGHYPDGVSDGPQIEANIEYILNNFPSKWGTPYKIIPVPMPDSPGGLWPDDGASYRTYANAVFVNKTVILPLYREEYDTTALKIWQNALPGYHLVGIDCDDNPENIISASGAVHCITHATGVSDPLLISHQPLPDTEDQDNPYSVVAYMSHRDGVSEAMLYWKTQIDGAYSSVSMSSVGENNWQGYIPAQPWGTTVYYYVQAWASTGKTQVRPMPAPEGYWSFDVLENIVFVEGPRDFVVEDPYPNPAHAITCIPVTSDIPFVGELRLENMVGQTVEVIHSGNFPQGVSRYFFHADQLSAGVYLARIIRDGISYPAKKIMIR